MCLGKEKEPKFFTNFGEKTWTGPATKGHVASLISDSEDYEANFEGLRDGQWALDASTDYIWCDVTPDLLAAFAENCEVRVICIVRDPVARATSEYNHTLREDWEDLSFSESLKAEQTRYDHGWHPLFYHQRRSTVCDDLRRFADRFEDRFLVVDYAELSDVQALTNRIFSFLGLSAIPVSEIARKNVSFLPRHPIAKAALNSSVLKRVGSALLPAAARKPIWDLLHTNARNVATVHEHELRLFRELLSEEIDKCVQDPLVPTDNWSSATLNK